jgi:hypothetical protein
MGSTNKSPYEEIARKMREVPVDEPVSSYEWEELVQKLCASDDAGLRAIGIIERDKLKQKRTERSVNKQVK